jgi:hypothetical protein
MVCVVAREETVGAGFGAFAAFFQLPCQPFFIRRYFRLCNFFQFTDVFNFSVVDQFDKFLCCMR